MSLVVYNTKTRNKEEFKPINEGRVGMYVCGPTVYGNPHLGHAKSYITFDVIYRYLMYLGYKVKYVQNITDVGHIVGDADAGEDKIGRQAVKENLDPYEIAYKYELAYFDGMEKMNVLKPSISARATGHIIEMIEMIETLIEKGYAYVTDEGNVYYSVKKFKDYGKLSNRTLDETVSGERIEISEDKESPEDFALWKKADATHLMRWPSPWSVGYPGWHIECSVMSKKYLGKTFDIHGGGMDNIFPHHECETAQSEAANGCTFVNYFIHNNLVTINGQKMGKSLGNSFALGDLFKEYNPILIRFYILQNHYRRPTDFTKEGLDSLKDTFNKLSETVNNMRNELKNVNREYTKDSEIEELKHSFIEAMNDDFNTGLAITYIYEASKLINKELTGNKDINKLLNLDNFIKECAEDILGLKFENTSSNKEKELLEIIKNIRKKYREEKNYLESDKLRDELKEIGITISDR